MADTKCSIQRAFVVTGGGCKRDGWVITDSELIEGIEFIKLNRLDTGFCRFVSGHAKGMRDMDFLEKLRWMRTQATIDLAKPPPAEGGNLFKVSASETKKAIQFRKKESQGMQARGELPLTCKVRLPAVVHNDGTTSPAMEVKVKSCLDPKENVMIELKAEILEHLRFVMLHSEQPASRKRPPSGAFHGVRFRAERKGFLATRKQDGKETYKTFKVDDDADELERAEIAERAQRWVEGGNFSDQEGDGSADVKGKSSDGNGHGHVEENSPTENSAPTSEAHGV